MKINEVNLRISAGFPSQFPRDAMPQIAFSGRSNVGKSSLINTLLGRKSLARVSGTPGKTITINFYEVNKSFFFTDLPGYGYAKRPEADMRKFSALTDGYFTKNPNIDLLKCVIQLVDARHKPTADDEMMLEYLNAIGLPYFIVVTKADKANKTDRTKMLEYIQNHPCVREGTRIIPFSSLKNEGKDEVWAEILGFCDSSK